MTERGKTIAWIADTCGRGVVLGSPELVVQDKYGSWFHCSKCDHSTWYSNTTVIGKCGECGVLHQIG